MSAFELKWGIVSTGWIAGHFAKETLVDPATRDVSDVKHRVVAVSSRSLTRAEAFITEYLGGVTARPQAYDSLEELVKDPNIDAIYIATPNTNHYTNALACLKTHKHVLVEKPSTMNARQTARLFEVARQEGQFLMEAHWTHFLPIANKVRQIMDSGVLGEIKHVDAKYLLDIRSQDLSPDDRYISLATGEGSLLDLRPYAWVWLYLTAYRASFGQPPNHQQQHNEAGWPIPHIGGASLTKMMFDSQDRPSNEVDESSLCSMVFPSAASRQRPGITGFFHTCLAVLPADGAPCCTVLGSCGKLTIDFPASKPERLTLETHDTHRPSQAPSHRKINVKKEVLEYKMPGECRGFVFEMDEVARCVRDGRLESDVLPGQASIVAMKVFDQIRKLTNLDLPADHEPL